jgi:hypothetical protein
VHEHVDPVEMAPILGAWKPRFIHSERSKKLVRAVIEEAGFPSEETHYDLPKPRTSFPVGHLNTGVAFAFPWHRDAWYSAPAQQINWWLPIFGVREDNAMSFDPNGFGRAVPNSSDTFDYYENNASRLTTASQVTRERQARPGAIDHKPDQELVVLPAPARSCCSPGLSCTPRRPTRAAGPVQRGLPDGFRPGPGGRARRPARGRELHRYRDQGFRERGRREQIRRGARGQAVRRTASGRHAGVRRAGQK